VTLVTLSASYGAGGSEIGPEVARLLDVPFVDRAIPVQVARRLAVPLGEAVRHDECVAGVLERVLTSVAPAVQPYVNDPVSVPADRHYREATEAAIRAQAETGAGVILGRAAQVVLHDHPHAFRVRLDGPREARIEQAILIGSFERDEAERQLDETDRARDAYIRHFYGRSSRDASLYHLVLDSTAIGLDLCVDTIVRAARSHAVRVPA
jgi:cytidylate kinase